MIISIMGRQKEYRQLTRQDKLFAWRLTVEVEVPCLKRESHKEEKTLTTWMNNVATVLDLPKPSVDSKGYYNEGSAFLGDYLLHVEGTFQGVGYSFGETDTLLSALSNILSARSDLGLSVKDSQLWLEVDGQ